jgi:hypothetical protein
MVQPQVFDWARSAVTWLRRPEPVDVGAGRFLAGEQRLVRSQKIFGLGVDVG